MFNLGGIRCDRGRRGWIITCIVAWLSMPFVLGAQVEISPSAPSEPAEVKIEKARDLLRL